MTINGRTYSTEDYRYGFNGMEKDDEISGVGNSYTAMFWQYDNRIARRWNIDPITYPHQSSYATFNNNPLSFIDPWGLKGERPKKKKHHGTGVKGGKWKKTKSRGGITGKAKKEADKQYNEQKKIEGKINDFQGELDEYNDYVENKVKNKQHVSIDEINKKAQYFNEKIQGLKSKYEKINTNNYHHKSLNQIDQTLVIDGGSDVGLDNDDSTIDGGESDHNFYLWNLMSQNQPGRTLLSTTTSRTLIVSSEFTFRIKAMSSVNWMLFGATQVYSIDPLTGGPFIGKRTLLPLTSGSFSRVFPNPHPFPIGFNINYALNQANKIGFNFHIPTGSFGTGTINFNAKVSVFTPFRLSGAVIRGSK